MSNAEAISPEFEVELGGKKRKFCLDVNALCELEKHLGKSVFKEIKWNDIGIVDMRLLFWGGLLTDDPTLKFDDFKKMLTLPALQRLMPVIQEAIERALPQAEPGADEKK